MIGIQGVTDDGRPAWLLSLARREWVVVQPELHQQLVRERQRWWIKGLLLLLLLMALNGLLDWFTDLHTVPWAALLLAQLHLLQEHYQWRRRLKASGEICQGGVRPLSQPREGFWLALSFAPAVMAVPVVLFNWQIAGISPRSFLYLMLLCWALIVTQIYQVRAVRALGRMPEPPA
jgi:hypothetical protein